ncbi:hypothetical protein ES703_27335 [subsurface metagenome]
MPEEGEPGSDLDIYQNPEGGSPTFGPGVFEQALESGSPLPATGEASFTKDMKRGLCKESLYHGQQQKSYN